MTTIAYQAGVLASDSRSTSGNFIYPETIAKIGVIEKHGVIYGLAGVLHKAIACVRELETLDELPWNGDPLIQLSDAEGEVFLIVIDHAGRVFEFEYGYWRESFAPYVTLGSGGTQAATAMYMGLGAIEAIKVAIAMDTCSGGDIQVLNVADLVAPRPPIKWPAPFVPHEKR